MVRQTVSAAAAIRNSRVSVVCERGALSTDKTHVFSKRGGRVVITLLLLHFY